ncbi:LacI family DNA-binding transcriptional regulator [Amnibacterium kyonggiense]|uniref:DNA-binding LacI/PurR family transcriptional regulator n=1 Tax=Amnibacterium kyonggiense TaxID=595671 RepID=A0A4R7FJ42_9MICO|nr:substrate-binding domain-containing protein [Amnibacterium kyonggiense]TDS75952.1 DNA-binding LacI/PurR family transcriptional regulator [Amnibacterium kyonggiense]
MPHIRVAVPFQDNWYFDAVLDGVRRRAARDGLAVEVQVEAPGRAGRSAVVDGFDAALGDPDCAGAVAVHFEFEPDQVARLRAHGRTVVVIGGACDGLPSILPDDAAGAAAATRHLLDLGHRAIAHLGGYATSPDDFSMRTDRVRGYSEAMRDAGLEAGSHVVPCEFTHDAAHRAATALLSDPDRPTAVFVVADELAFAVLDAADDLGLGVPGDLSVIGIDDHVGAAARGLTTFRQDVPAIGEAAVERVLGITEFERLETELTLVPRSTTAPPGAAAPPARRGGLLGLLSRRR